MAIRQARSTAASSRTGGYKPSGIGAKARAAATALKNTVSSHLSPEQFGRHARAIPTRDAAMRNARGGSAYEGRHRSGQLAAGEPGHFEAPRMTS